MTPPSDTELDPESTEYARLVGERLRAVRRQKRLSLQAAEELSAQEFKASVPPMDWKTRSTGAPREMASMDVVTWVSTQLCVGI